MSYSPNLSYFLDKLSGYSTNYFRLEAQNSTTASANQIVRFTLPSNALLNLRSFAFHFTATTASSGGGIARLPPDISSLIERVEVSCGGVQLSAGANYYNVLCAAKRALTDKMVDPVLGHPEMMRAVSYVDGAAKTGNEVYTGATSKFCVKQWEGFLGTAEPKIMDSSLVPDLVVSIYLADDSVLANVKGTALPGTTTTGIDIDGTGSVSYSLANIHATIECIGLADGTYDNMVSSMIQTKGFLEVPFKQYYSFQDTHSGQMRFSVATQSLDRIWAVSRNADFNTASGAVLIDGYKEAGAFVSVAAANVDGTNFDVGVPGFDVGGMLDYNKERMTTAALDFPEPTGTNLTYQFQLNGAYMPQFRATFEEMYQISANSVNGSTQNKVGLETMRTNFAVQCIRLNLPESEFGRLISGLNTRSVSLNGFYNISGLSGTAPTVNLFAECTSTLLIGSGRQLSVEQ
tara:strand:+ start:595 stop:1977 length:1383 start_codon:yes stop_codon:yes gene_type:complete